MKKEYDMQQAEINKLKEGKADIEKVEAALKEQEEYFNKKISDQEKYFKDRINSLTESTIYTDGALGVLTRIIKTPWSLIDFWFRVITKHKSPYKKFTNEK